MVKMLFEYGRARHGNTRPQTQAQKGLPKWGPFRRKRPDSAILLVIAAATVAVSLIRMLPL